MAALIGAADVTLAVPEAAQAVVLAAAAAFSDRRPILVVTATGLDAERLGDDLDCLLPSEDGDGTAGALDGTVAVLPAWETLPFERVSPEVETMGRRLALLHALVGGADESLPAPRVVVAPVRALLQRLGPLDDTAPELIRPGQRVDLAELLPRLVAKGYRREHQVEYRGEFAVRGGIVDVFPPTADEPVRIDLWGDEVDRLTAFSVSDQRSWRDLAGVALYGCRELTVNTAVAAEAEQLIRRRPWGAAVWDRLARGEQFDGMESWLPFVGGPPRVLPDLLPAGAHVVLVEPRRIRDRAVQLLEEEAALAETLAATWGAKEAEEDDFPRMHVPFERLLVECPAPVTSLPPVPEGPGTPTMTVRRFEPVAGDPSRLAAGVSRLVGEAYQVALCAATGPGASRLVGRARGTRCARPGRACGTGVGGSGRGGGADQRRVRPPRLQGGGAVGDGRDGPAHAAPAGQAAGAGRGWVLRRPRGRELRRPPPARRGALRRGDDAHHGRNGSGLSDTAVPRVGPPVPPGRPD